MASFLEEERARASFDIREMTFFLDGGQERTKRREDVEALVESDPIFSNSDLYNLSRPERHRRAMQKQRRLLELCRSGCGAPSFSLAELRGAVHDMLGTDLQSLMFIPNIKATFTNEQQAQWLPRAERWEIIGCYAQTELGHGSNVRALETTATFIAETDEIEIHSPSLTSTKWWPGAMGRTANYAIVYARLIVEGRDLGIHNFMVQIRDLETHRPMPGVQVGDIGPKIGYNNQDNGFCRFERVRIPRTHMAMRQTTLHPDGRYEATEGRRTASYSAMTGVRVEIVLTTGYALSMACTIAIRYSAVRRQGFTSKDDGSEMCILDYTMQQERLLPLLATAYAFHCAGATMRAILKGDAATLHVASSGLKALCSRIAGDGIETCRRACGGHGYLAASGLPELLGTYLQNVTVEGENYMIAQQTTRGLLKLLSSSASATFKNAWEGDHSAYLNSTAAMSAQCRAETSKDFLSMEIQCEAYCQRSAWVLSELQAQLQRAQAAGAAPVDAWNECCPDVIRASEAHCFYVLVRSFWSTILLLRQQGSSLVPVLESCCHLFALWWMRENLGDFLQSGFLTAQQGGLLRQAVRDLLPVLRADAVPLVDAWGHSDHCLNSALGRRDGRVYEALWDSVQPEVNPMNKDEALRKKGPSPGADPSPSQRSHRKAALSEGVLGSHRYVSAAQRASGVEVLKERVRAAGLATTRRDEDRNFLERAPLRPSEKKLVVQLEKDVDFLEKHGRIDYSLLSGRHGLGGLFRTDMDWGAVLAENLKRSGPKVHVTSALRKPWACFLSGPKTVMEQDSVGGTGGGLACVGCGSREELLVFEKFSGAFQSACRHAACEPCLRNWTLKELPKCRQRWMLRVECPCQTCGRQVPQALPLKVSAHARALADAIDASSANKVADQLVEWPALPNEALVCPRCGEEKDQVLVNTACGHGACRNCWLADLPSKLEWCKAYVALDVPCGHEGCSEGCFEVLKHLDSPVIPEVKSYVEQVQSDLLEFSPWCVHEANAGAPGPVCPSCECRVTALLYCCCQKRVACKQCWDSDFQQKLHWLQDNFAFVPDHLHEATCKGPDALSLLSSQPTSSFFCIQRHRESLTEALKRVSLVLLRASRADPHAACERCWMRWAEEQLEECFAEKKLPRCLWPQCQVDHLAKDCVWELVQQSSAGLQELLGKLKRRKRLQNNPLFPAALQVECPRCVGIGYLGFDTVMCFLCEYQWEDSGEKPLELSAGECPPEELQVAGVRVQRCPKCREYIEKNGGCDHMTCRCRHQFSWSTLKPWGSVVG
ncbi:A chain [Durusdinium trenchii]|uniref:acyl-CoA oxidase n=1 Tax=Durusdinium trenchii TaxID=1381693 RepID=A0ABP0N3G2_9DINO